MNMNAAQLSPEADWITVCYSAELRENLGTRALLNGVQVAIFRVRGQVYAVNATDPFSKAAVLSRGLVGDVGGQVVVTSPIYKQHFNLFTGVCLEDESVALQTYEIRELDGQIQLKV